MAAVRAHAPRPPPACRSPSTPWPSLVVPCTSLPLSLTLLRSSPSSVSSSREHPSEFVAAVHHSRGHRPPLASPMRPGAPSRRPRPPRQATTPRTRCNAAITTVFIAMAGESPPLHSQQRGRPRAHQPLRSIRCELLRRSPPSPGTFSPANANIHRSRELDRKSTRLNSSHHQVSRMPSSA